MAARPDMATWRGQSDSLLDGGCPSALSTDWAGYRRRPDATELTQRP